MAEEGPEIITRKDVQIEMPEINGTAIVIQRHEEYQRDATHPQLGSLIPEAATRSTNQTVEVFGNMVDQLTPEERKTIDVMVIGSPTQYLHGGKRSLETAQAIINGVKEVFQKYNLPSTQLLNEQPRLKLDGKPIPSKMIVEPKIFTESPEFVTWLKENYGQGNINKDFWTAYEEDSSLVKEKRVEMGAEGPKEMADRLANFLYALKKFSENYHQKNPGKRLILWAASHYDTISPFIKTRIGGGKDGYLGVDYGAGIGINLKSNGECSTKIAGITYPIDLIKTVTASSIE